MPTYRRQLQEDNLNRTIRRRALGANDRTTLQCLASSTHTHTLSLSPSHTDRTTLQYFPSCTHTHTHSLSLFLSLSLTGRTTLQCLASYTHKHTLCPSLSLSHTQTVPHCGISHRVYPPTHILSFSLTHTDRTTLECLAYTSTHIKRVCVWMCTRIHPHTYSLSLSLIHVYMATAAT